MMSIGLVVCMCWPEFQISMGSPAKLKVYLFLNAHDEPSQWWFAGVALQLAGFLLGMLQALHHPVVSSSQASLSLYIEFSLALSLGLDNVIITYPEALLLTTSSFHVYFQC